MSHRALFDALQAEVPKHFRQGEGRLVPPGETLARIRPLMPVMGITRIANLTGLDHLGVPVTSVCRPNSRSLAVSQGKGVDLAAARASGLMEAVEAHHAERILSPLLLATFEELRYTHTLADISRLPRRRNASFHLHLPILWIEGLDIVQHTPVWLPFDLVHTNYTVGLRSVDAGFIQTSNGLASGNHLLEAILHGLCEVVERDATTLWSLRDDARRHATRLDLSTVHDSVCRGLLDTYARAGIDVAVWDATSDVGIPVYVCRILERHDEAARRLGFSQGMGCHPNPRVAFLRALTEAAQSRLTLISGARDDHPLHEYDRLRSPAVMTLHRADVTNGPLPFDPSVGWDAATVSEDTRRVTHALASAGCDRVIVVDLTRPEFRIPVVRVVVPGLETIAHTAGWVPGQRARAILESHHPPSIHLPTTA